MTDAILELAGISKAFAGIHAVRDVDARARARARARAGRPERRRQVTLMNIIGGVVQPDGGAMRLAGAPYAPAKSRGGERDTASPSSIRSSTSSPT